MACRPRRSGPPSPRQLRMEGSSRQGARVMMKAAFDLRTGNMTVVLPSGEREEGVVHLTFRKKKKGIHPRLGMSAITDIVKAAVDALVDTPIPDEEEWGLRANDWVKDDNFMAAFREQVLKDQQFQTFWTQSLALLGQQPPPPPLQQQQQVHEKTEEREDVSGAPSTPARSTTHDMVKTEDDESLWEPDAGNASGLVHFDEWAMPAAEEEKQREQQWEQGEQQQQQQQEAPSPDADPVLLPPNTPPIRSGPSTAECVEAAGPTPATDSRSYKRHGVDGEEEQTGAKRAKRDNLEVFKDAVKGEIIAMRFDRDDQRLTRAFLALVKPKKWVLELLECAMRHGATVATGVNIVVDVANTLPYDQDEWTGTEKLQVEVGVILAVGLQHTADNSAAQTAYAATLQGEDVAMQLIDHGSAVGARKVADCILSTYTYVEQRKS